MMFITYNFIKFLSLLPVHVISQVSRPSKILVNRNCFVNFVVGNVSDRAMSVEEQDDPARSGYPTDILVKLDTVDISYLVYHFEQLDDVIEQDDITFRNFTMQDKYFRYFVKNGYECHLVVLFTPTFTTTIDGIYNSGLGTSNNVLFLVHVDKIPLDNEVTSAFRSSQLYTLNIDPFHSNIVFFDDSNGIGLFCYFCAKEGGLIVNNVNETISVENLKRSISKLNSGGYVKNVRLHAVTLSSDLYVSQECLTHPHDETSNLRRFYDSCLNCEFFETFMLSTLQPVLNFTLVKDTSYLTPQQVSMMNWHLQIYFGGSLLFLYPNYYAFTRGHQMYLTEWSVKLLACMDLNSIQKLDYLFIFGAFLDITVWGGVTLVALAYAFIFRSLSLCISIIFLLILSPIIETRPRRHTMYALPCVAFISYVYAGYVNTDAMDSFSFPFLPKLFEVGYKWWIHRSTSSRVAETLRQATEGMFGRSFLRIFGLEENSKEQIMLKQDDKEFVDLPEEVSKLISEITTRKLILQGNLFKPIKFALSKHFRAQRLFKKYYCRLHTIRSTGTLNLFIPTGIRLHGYMSEKVYQALNAYAQGGLFLNENSFKYRLVQQHSMNLQLEETGGLEQPKPLASYSLLGLATLYLVAFGLCLLTIHLFPKLKQGVTMLHNRVKHLLWVCCAHCVRKLLWNSLSF